MSNQQQGTRGAKPGNAEFPSLRELMPGDSLTPLDPRLINPIIRAYNALVRAEGRGKTADGKNTLQTKLAAGGFVIEIVPTPTSQTIVGQDVKTGGGGTIPGSGVTYDGVWSSGGTYLQNAIVIHTSSSQNGLFIRVSATAGAGIEPFTGSYTTDWTLIGRWFTDSLTIKGASNAQIVFNALAQTANFAHTTTRFTQLSYGIANFIVQENANAYYSADFGLQLVRFQVSSTSGFTGTPGFLGAQNANVWATLNAQNSTIRINSTATEFSEIRADGIKSVNNANTAYFTYIPDALSVAFTGGGSVVLTNAAANGRALTIRELEYCDAGVLKKFLTIATALY